MELDQTLSVRIEELLEQLEQLDPAEVPQPAAELAELLSELLEGTGPT